MLSFFATSEGGLTVPGYVAVAIILFLVLIIHILFRSPFSKKPFSLIKQSSHNVLIIAEYHVGENSIFRAAELTVEWTIDGLLMDC